MSDYFTTNWIQKAKTDPVANGLLNKQKVRSYRFIDVAGDRAADDFGVNARGGISDYLDPDIINDTTITNEPINMSAPRMNIISGKSYAQNPRIGLSRIGYVTEHYLNNPNDYWQNQVPQNLYNLNYVNTPNPIFNLLRKAPISISSIHQSFSS